MIPVNSDPCRCTSAGKTAALKQILLTKSIFYNKSLITNIENCQDNSKKIKSNYCVLPWIVLF